MLPPGQRWETVRAWGQGLPVGGRCCHIRGVGLGAENQMAQAPHILRLQSVENLNDVIQAGPPATQTQWEGTFGSPTKLGTGPA